MAHLVESKEYGGFVSYGNKPVATKKPGLGDYYVKDVYKDISNYNKRKIKYFEDKDRFTSIYTKDIINPISEKDYLDKKNKFSLDNYEYCHNDDIRKIITDKEKNEEIIRDRFANSSTSVGRKKMFSNWNSTYNIDNQNVIENKKDFKKNEIPEWFKNRYHNYHRSTYNTDFSKTMGIHGDNPNEKLKLTQYDGRLYRDNIDVELGTTKASNIIPGYLGHIPVNRPEKNYDYDPYFSVNKTNHKINYKTRLIGYKGHVPSNEKNIKGNIRPHCLSIEGETFK